MSLIRANRWEMINGVAAGVIYVDTIADLQAMPTSGLVDGQEASVKGNALHWDAVSVQWIPGDMIGIEAFGAVGDGVTDNATAFAGMYAFLEDYRGSITAGPGVFYTNSTLHIPRLASLEGAGSRSTTITAQGSSGTFDRAVVLKTGDQPVLMPGLSANVSKGDFQITFTSGHSLSRGDVFLIYNPADFSYSGFRANYRAGEFCKVDSVVDAATIILSQPLYANYQAVEVDVYRCESMGSGTISGFTAIAPGPAGVSGFTRATMVEFCRDIIFLDLCSDNSENASMSVSLSINGSGRDIRATQNSNESGIGTNYGLSFSSCQCMRFDKGEYIGRRHAVAAGSGGSFSVPCRDIHVIDFVARSYDGALAAVDWHGNTEHSSYRDGSVYGGGLNFRGNHNLLSNIKGYGDNAIVALGGELSGCDHVLENIEFKTGRDDISRGLIDIGGNTAAITENTKEGGTFVFRNIRIIAPNNTRFGIYIRNRGFIGKWNVVAQNVEYDAPSSDSDSFGAVSLNSVSGDPCTLVEATGIKTINTTATPPLTLGASELSATLVRQDPVIKLTSVTTSTSSANVLVTVPLTKRFSKDPFVTVTAAAKSSSGAGLDTIAPYYLPTTSPQSEVRVGVFRADDSANFLAAGTIPLYLKAEIWEW